MINYLYAFIIGGFICMIGQVLIEYFKFTPGIVTSLFVVVGGLLEVFGIYEKIVSVGGAGGFLPITNFGSFSDISFLCPAWEVAGVNLSVGYYNEHSNSEYLCVGQLFDIIEKVKLMLKDVENVVYFKYIKMPEEKHWFQSMEFFSNILAEGQDKKKCCLCGEQDYEYNLVPVKVKNGKVLNYCITCLNTDESVFWCLECGEPFINENLSDSYCEDCRGKN